MPREQLSISDNKDSLRSLVSVQGDTAQPTTPLLENTLNDYLDWVQKELLFEDATTHSPAISKTQASAITQKIIHYFLGAVAAAVAYPYGYGFGASLPKVFEQDSPVAEKALGLYFGLTATLAFMALVGGLTHKTFSNLTKSTPTELKKILQKSEIFRNLPEKTRKAIVWSIGLIASSPTVYICEKFFSQYIGLFSLVPDFITVITMTATRSWALNNVTSELLKKLSAKICSEPKAADLGIARISLIADLNNSLQKINEMSSEEIDDLFDFMSVIKKSEGTTISSSHSDIMHKNLAYFTLGNDIIESQDKQDTPPVPGINFIRGFAGVVGLLSASSLYSLGEKAAESICDYFQIDEPNTRSAMKSTFAICSYMGEASLRTYTNVKIMEGLYTYGYNKLYGDAQENTGSNALLNNKFFNFVLSALALSSTTPRVQLVIEYVQVNTWLKAIFGTCTALSIFSLDLWSMRNMTTDFTTKVTPKSQLIGSVNKLKAAIPNMQEDNIYQLSSAIRNPQTFFKNDSNQNVPEEYQAAHVFSSQV